MRKFTLIIALGTAFAASNTTKAQVTTYPNGKIAINTNSEPQADISINSPGVSSYYVFLQTANKNAMSARSAGNNVSGWRFSGEFSNFSTGGGFFVGARGDVHPEDNQERNSGRAYGVFGSAGYATNGWNYGIFGRLSSSQNGTGIYGTSNPSENGIYIDGRYAGYFNGATKIAGSLTVTGKISGTILSQAVSSSNAIEAKTYSNDMTDLEKMSTLKAISYYQEQPIAIQSTEGDTVANTHELTDIEIQNYEKAHYGLPVEQLEEVYPNLVYVNEDGSKCVNYIELIPILVQSINELKEEINSLKQTTKSIANSTNNQSISVNLDGKTIGIKKTKICNQ